jgi:hypothetical protein
MPHPVTVWYEDPDGKLRPTIPPLDLDQTVPVWITDDPREGPLFKILRGGSDVSLHIAPMPVKKLWFVRFLPFRRLSDIEVRWPKGRVEPIESSGTREESHRRHWGVAEEEAWAFARHYEKEKELAQALLTGPPPAAKVNQDKDDPTVTLEDGVARSVSPEGAAVVDILIRNAPRLITYRQMTQDPILRDQNPTKIGRDIIDKLPKPVRARIQRDPGKGCIWFDG